MISTIRGAEEVYKDENIKNIHKDELWIWIPMVDIAIEHLKSFLNQFQKSEELQNNDLEIEYLGQNQKELEQIFSESFLKITKKITKLKEPLPLVILKYNAASINSRKSMIAPYLPNRIN